VLPRFLRRGPQQATDTPGRGACRALDAEIVSSRESGSAAKALSESVEALARQGLVRGVDHSA
jgi:hypothetical protein